MKGIIVALSVLGIIAAIVWSVVMDYQFNRLIGEYMKLAADAPTVELASKYLNTATDNMRARGLTSGNTAYILKTPKNDVALWFKQVDDCRATVDAILARATSADPPSQLERDNALMKVREVLTDNGETGTKITAPSAITLHPHRVAFTLWVLACIVLSGGVTVKWYAEQ